MVHREAVHEHHRRGFGIVAAVRIYVVAQFNRHIFLILPYLPVRLVCLAFAPLARLVLLAGPRERLPHDGAVTVGHLPDEGVEHVSGRVDPFHIERLVLRLAIAGDRHHVAQRDRMLAWIVIVGQAGCREEFGHGERLQADRQLRQAISPKSFATLRATASRNDSW